VDGDVFWVYCVDNGSWFAECCMMHYCCLVGFVIEDQSSIFSTYAPKTSYEA
jgi:hypothetical protein